MNIPQPMADTVPVNSLYRHIAPFQDSLSSVAHEVINSGYFILGPGLQAFETAFADYCGVPYCIGVANGTDALELSLRAAGVKDGDNVAVVANAAMYGTSAVLACNATPVFVDVLANEATMDPALLAEAFGRAEKVKAVIVTHLYGRLARIEEIAKLCEKHNAVLIEDCAQSHGAKTEDGRMAGSFGALACFSFYPTKNLGAIGDGGAVVAKEEALASRIRELRQYGWTQKYTNTIPGGRNSRLDELQASMLSIMLPHLDAWNARRREIANRYSVEINNPRILTPEPAGADYVAHLYVVRSEKRDELKSFLAAHAIGSEVHYPNPDHLQPCHGGRFDSCELPVTELNARLVLTLPCFPELTDSEVGRVIDVCNRF